MDPRQQHPPQHPYRNSSPLYSRSPFPPAPSSAASTQAPYPSASHAPPPPPTTSTYADHHHQRRPSDTPYYPSPRSYPSEPASSSGHSRHPSAASSMAPGPPLNRTMPPPSSPPQQGQGQPGSHPIGSYGLPQPRPPPVSVGPPTAFPSGRELPALSSIARTANSSQSSMSISSMLGAPAPAREQPPPPSQYPPAATSTAGPSGASYPPPIHASPRMHASAADYGSYRRPQTPEHHRPSYDVRDQRGSTAASPQGLYSTPEVQRYGTPQAYSQRGPPLTAAEQAREQSRMSAAMPPRPSSQPKSFPAIPPPRPMDMGGGRPGAPESLYGRREDLGRSVEYNPERPGPMGLLKYEEPRHAAAERERQEREMEMRDRERRERAMSGGEQSRPYPTPQDYHHRQTNFYGRQSDPREPGHWAARQQPFDHQKPYDPAAQHHGQPPEYPGSNAAAPYASRGSYQHAPQDRYPPATHPTAHQPPVASGGRPPIHVYDSPEYHRSEFPNPQHQPPPPPPPRSRPADDGPPPPSVAYSGGGGPAPHFDSPRNRAAEEAAAPQRPGFLAIQEINRKGRTSPLPQAVQGAQPQLAGPAGEPAIKSEFGRMFAGIGSGVGMGTSSPVAAGAQLPFTTAGMARRDDADTPTQDAADKSNREGARTKRRKVKEEEIRAGDDESNGRLTPLGRVKRQKTHPHHHHQYVDDDDNGKRPRAPRVIVVPDANQRSHHHHHHHHAEPTSSPSNPTPLQFKNVKTSTPSASPTVLGRDLPPHHSAPARSAPHGLPHGAKANGASTGAGAVAAAVMVKPKQTVSSKAVLDSVAQRPRHHLGDYVYEQKLRAARLQDPSTGRPPRYAYSSTPRPLPMDLIRDKENCTLTVKISKVYLTPAAREEITYRRAVWGTDVYTDDSDVLAACIHAGWIRGEWPDEVDVDLLSLDEGIGATPKDAAAARPGRRSAPNGGNTASQQQQQQQQQPSPEVLAAPPKTGPVYVPEGKDLHVTVLVLPTLEKYTSTTRFGLRSREWGGGRQDGHQPHDGISFMILGLRWVTNGAGAQSRLRGKARRERIRQALKEVELAPVRSTELARALGNEMRRGRAADKDGVAAAGGGAWWRTTARKPSSDGDKENQPLPEADDDDGAPPRRPSPLGTPPPVELKEQDANGGKEEDVEEAEDVGPEREVAVAVEG